VTAVTRPSPADRWAWGRPGTLRLLAAQLVCAATGLVLLLGAARTSGDRPAAGLAALGAALLVLPLLPLPGRRRHHDAGRDVTSVVRDGRAGTRFPYGRAELALLDVLGALLVVPALLLLGAGVAVAVVGAVVLAAVNAVRGRVRGRPRGEVVLDADGVTLRGWVLRRHLGWDDVALVRAVPVRGSTAVVVVAEPHAGRWASFSVPAPWVAADPVLLLWTLRHHAHLPADRHELGSEAALHRIRSGAVVPRG
jgi:hypothetical protein